MDYVTIDFEASCLPRHGRSFPIEVGISGPLGTFSWLIKPPADWREWDWTDEAGRLHGISRAQLDADGLDPAVVVAEVMRVVGSARVIADSQLDRIWWRMLLEAAKPAGGEAIAAASLRIEHVSQVLDELGASARQIQFAQQRADWLCPAQHRAGADAQWLFTLLATLAQRIAEDREETLEKWPSELSNDIHAPAIS